MPHKMCVPRCGGINVYMCTLSCQELFVKARNFREMLEHICMSSYSENIISKYSRHTNVHVRVYTCVHVYVHTLCHLLQYSCPIVSTSTVMWAVFIDSACAVNIPRNLPHYLELLGTWDSLQYSPILCVCVCARAQ